MTRFVIVATTVGVLATQSVCAQLNDAPEPEPQQEEAGEEKQERVLPDLDELLGLESEENPDDPDRLTADDLDPAQKDLDRRLSGEEIAEEFVQAARLMDETADRLQLARDTSLVTQRLQDDIIRKLDIIIKEAQQQQQSSSSSSSSQQQQQQQQPNQQQQQSRSNQGENQTEQTPPGAQPADMNPVAAAAGAAWGALPERLRDSLTQGASDPFSTMYRSLTESYYRRLAEEADR